jgi:riboflavin synthase
MGPARFCVVKLTELTERSFTVTLIPFTCEHTALGALKENDAVNLETDLIGKHVSRALEMEPRPITWERLREAGFGNAG